MHCPVDGTRIGGPPRQLVTGTYSPCPECGAMWRCSEKEGTLELVATSGVEVGEVLKALGADRRDRAVDVLVDNIVDAMEKKAQEEGQSTYYTGTYAVGLGSYSLIHAGLTCEAEPNWHGNPPSLRWISFMGDDWEVITRQQAIEVLLAERK